MGNLLRHVPRDYGVPSGPCPCPCCGPVTHMQLVFALDVGLLTRDSWLWNGQFWYTRVSLSESVDATWCQYDREPESICETESTISGTR